MKKNKALSVFLILVIIFSFSACSKDEPSSSIPDFSIKSCSEIIQEVYDRCEGVAFFNQLKTNENKLVTTEILPDGEGVTHGCSSYFGTKIDFESAFASEPEIQPPAYSFCVAKMKAGSDMEEAASKVRENANPQKWFCTGVSTVYVEVSGNVLALIMADKETAEALRSIFLSLDIKASAKSSSASSSTSSSSTSTTKTPASSANEAVSEEILEIIGKIYLGAKDNCERAESYFSEYKAESFYEGTLSSGSKEYFGAPIEFNTAVCSTSMMAPDPFFLCLIKPNSPDDIEGIMATITDKAELNWQVCVSAEKVEVATKGGYVFMIMGSKNEVETLKASFLALDLK